MSADRLHSLGAESYITQWAVQATKDSWLRHEVFVVECQTTAPKAQNNKDRQSKAVKHLPLAVCLPIICVCPLALFVHIFMLKHSTIARDTDSCIQRGSRFLMKAVIEH